MQGRTHPTWTWTVGQSTALVLLGFAVSVESKRGKPIASGLAISITTFGIAIAAYAAASARINVASESTLLVVDPMAWIFKLLVLGLGLLAVLLPPARNEIRSHFKGECRVTADMAAEMGVIEKHFRRLTGSRAAEK